MGSNIIEINSISGEAVVNRPVYVGPGYPLLPDFDDLQLETSSSDGQDMAVLQDLVAQTMPDVSMKEPIIISSIGSKR